MQLSLSVSLKSPAPHNSLPLFSWLSHSYQRKIACTSGCFMIPASGQRHTPLSAAHTAGCPGAVSAPVHHSALPLSFPQRLSGDRSPTAPSPQQAVDYTLPRRSLSAPHQCQHTLSVVVAASPPPKPFLRNSNQAERRPFCLAGTVIA
jgi:hypothetical protein